MFLVVGGLVGDPPLKHGAEMNGERRLKALWGASREGNAGGFLLISIKSGSGAQSILVCRMLTTQVVGLWVWSLEFP